MATVIIPTLPRGELPPMLIIKGKKGRYFVVIYKNQWDKVNKRSMRVGTRVVGTIKNYQKDGEVCFNQEFIAANPWIDEYVVTHQGRKWDISIRTEDDIYDPQLTEAEAPLDRETFLNLSPVDQENFLRRVKSRQYMGGAAYALGQIAEQSGLSSALAKVFSRNSQDLKLLSLIFYIVINSKNALSHYPEFAEMTYMPYRGNIDSSAASRLLKSITLPKIEEFLELMSKKWMEEHHSDQKTPIFLALDSTSISTYSQELDQAERGHNKDGDDLDQLNILMLADHKTGLPVYFRLYNGAVPDVSTVEGVIRSAIELGMHYRVVLVSDRGYTSSGNITEALIHNIGFLFNCKVNASGHWVQDEINKVYEELKAADSYKPLIGQHAVTSKIMWNYDPHPVEGKRKSYRHGKELTVHLYFDPKIYETAKSNLLNSVAMLRDELNSGVLNEQSMTTAQKNKAARLLQQVKDKRWKINGEALEKELRFSGIRALVTDTVEDAIEAHRVYSERQVVESAFLTLKHRLGCDRFLTSDNDSTLGKCFLQFLATSLSLMVRRRLAQWEDSIKSGERKGEKLIHMSDSRVLESLHTIRVTPYEGIGLIYDEVVGKKRKLMEALGVEPPSKTRHSQSCKDGIDTGEQPDESDDTDLVTAP